MQLPQTIHHSTIHAPSKLPIRYPRSPLPDVFSSSLPISFIRDRPWIRDPIRFFSFRLIPSLNVILSLDVKVLITRKKKTHRIPSYHEPSHQQPPPQPPSPTPPPYRMDGCNLWEMPHWFFHFRLSCAVEDRDDGHFFISISSFCFVCENHIHLRQR